jgi:hypothetical protein
VSAVLPTTGPKLRRCPRQRQRMIVGRGWWLGAALPQHGPREWSQLDGEPCSRSPRATVHSAASCAVAHS